jgi:hypothetical protein
MTLQISTFENPFINIIKKVFEENYGYKGSLDEIHSLLDTPSITHEQKEYHTQIHEWSKDRDSVFVKKFHEYVDKNTLFNETYYNFLRTTILPRFPKETQLVIQKTPNIRFSLPNTAAIGCDPKDPKNIVGLHCDRDFGHHETEMNFVIPITRMFDTNSIYYEPTELLGDNIDPLHYENLVLNENEYVKAYFNQIKHCNRINQTNKTRISFDIRVIPYSKYIQHVDDFKGTKFELGKYYVVL